MGYLEDLADFLGVDALAVAFALQSLEDDAQQAVPVASDNPISESSHHTVGNGRCLEPNLDGISVELIVLEHRELEGQRVALDVEPTPEEHIQEVRVTSRRNARHINLNEPLKEVIEPTHELLVQLQLRVLPGLRVGLAVVQSLDVSGLIIKYVLRLTIRSVE
jgi:hypothetical protein